MTRGRRGRGALVAAIAMAAWAAGAGCRQTAPAAAGAGKASPPRGDAVWFTDPAGVGDSNLEDRLAKLSTVAVFLPAGEVAFDGGRWSLAADAVPPRPLAGKPIVLVVRAGPQLSAALAGEAGPDVEGVSTALGEGLEAALRADGPYGRVVGVHLDFPFTAVSARRSGELLDAARRRMPAGTFVSIAAGSFSARTEESRKALRPLVDRADALVAPVFGFDAPSEAAAIDALQRPWWAAFAVAVRGTLQRAGGGASETVDERVLEALSGDPRIDFENDLAVPDASYASFHLTARRPVRVAGLELAPGDRITYRIPVVTELLYQLGSTLSGKRHALGRLLVFGGTEDAARVFPVAAFEDVILGRSLAPEFAGAVRPAGKSAIAVDVVNTSSHASIASRTSNWVEVDVAPSHPADVTLGGFDRYATYDRDGLPVSPGRATRVRLFETLVGPGESVSPARIVLRGGVPKDCCRYRTHLIAASGAEMESSWMTPPVPPTPTPAPARKKR